MVSLQQSAILCFLQCQHFLQKLCILLPGWTLTLLSNCFLFYSAFFTVCSAAGLQISFRFRVGHRTLSLPSEFRPKAVAFASLGCCPNMRKSQWYHLWWTYTHGIVLHKIFQSDFVCLFKFSQHFNQRFGWNLPHEWYSGILYIDGSCPSLSHSFWQVL